MTSKYSVLESKLIAFLTLAVFLLTTALFPLAQASAAEIIEESQLQPWIGFWLAEIQPEYVDVHLWYKFVTPEEFESFVAEWIHTPIVEADSFTTGQADHLTGSSSATDDTGGVVQLLDYYPYGELRIDDSYSTFDEQRKFTGHEYDRSTGLNYMNARYYEGSLGRFLSQDPVFIAIGDSGQIKQVTGSELQQILSDPQNLNSGRTMGGLNSGFASGWSGNTRSRGNSISQAEWLADPQGQNSYAYARNNPLKYVDPDGEAYQIPIALGLGFVGGVVGQYYSDVVNNYQSGVQGLSVFKPASSIETYGVRGTQGAIVGASALTGSPYIIGGATAGTSVLGDQWLGQQTNLTQTGVDAVLNAGTAGVFKLFPGVPGRLPNFGTQAFFTGKHTQQELTKEAINVLIGGIKDTINAISNSIKELKKSK